MPVGPFATSSPDVVRLGGIEHDYEPIPATPERAELGVLAVCSYKEIAPGIDVETIGVVHA
ncbi:MAG: hypothetical protein WA484_08025 [Solirubrobacteraceae bacterium]